MDRETLVWALVFSLPVGVGITGLAADVVGRGPLDPLAIAAGLATTAVLFSVFAFAAGTGSPDPDRAEP